MELVSDADDHHRQPRNRLLAGVERYRGYAAVNITGAVLCTFDDDLDRAKAWVKDRSVVHDGLHLVEVIRTERVVYTPRVRRVA